jgi:hypothetical protein
MPQGLPIGNRSRRNRHILVMSPDPRRYRDIFEKVKRRNKLGEVDQWYEGVCKPRIGHGEADYIPSEQETISDNFGSLAI